MSYINIYVAININNTLNENDCNDKKKVLSSVKLNGHLLQYASDKLKNDFDVVLCAIKQNPHALMYASEKFLNNYDIVLKAI